MVLRTKRVLRDVHHAGDDGVIRAVPHHCRDVAFATFLDQLLQFFGAPAVDDAVCAAGDKVADDRGADAGGCAGDDGDAVLEGELAGGVGEHSEWYCVRGMMNQLIELSRRHAGAVFARVL